MLRGDGCLDDGCLDDFTVSGDPGVQQTCGNACQLTPHDGVIQSFKREKLHFISSYVQQWQN